MECVRGVGSSRVLRGCAGKEPLGGLNGMHVGVRPIFIHLPLGWVGGLWGG